MEYKSESLDGSLVYYWYAWNYDDSGLLEKKIKLDSKGNESGSVWTYSYDELRKYCSPGRCLMAHGRNSLMTKMVIRFTCTSYDQDGEQYDGSGPALNMKNFLWNLCRSSWVPQNNGSWQIWCTIKMKTGRQKQGASAAFAVCPLFSLLNTRFFITTSLKYTSRRPPEPSGHDILH